MSSWTNWSVARALLLAPCVSLFALFGAPLANASSFVLSQASSDETPADWLDATVSFDVAQQGPDWILTLTLANDTSAPAPRFDISELYFNTKSNINSLELLSATHSANNVGDVTEFWSLVDSSGEGELTKADGFGTFSYALLDGVGNDQSQAGPGEGVVFAILIDGTGPFDMTDFNSGSIPINNETPSYVVSAKFVNGAGQGVPSDDSAFGGTEVPEPGSLVLLGLGLAGLAGLRRRTA